MSQCTANSKRTGQQCGKWAMRERTVCYFHGGKTPRGKSLPQTKHGRYSKGVPSRILSAYVLARDNPGLLSIREEIALIDTRTVEFIKRLRGDERSDRGTWREIRSLIDQRRKLVESERNRMIDMREMMTADQGVLLVARLYDAVVRHVHDPQIQAAIAADLETLFD